MLTLSHLAKAVFARLLHYKVTSTLDALFFISHLSPAHAGVD